MKQQNFIKAYNELAQEFAEKYYWEEAYIDSPVEENDYWLHPILISDDCWSIDDIFLALQLDIPKEVIHSYYAYAYDIYDTEEERQNKMNLYAYYKKWNN